MSCWSVPMLSRNGPPFVQIPLFPPSSSSRQLNRASFFLISGPIMSWAPRVCLSCACVHLCFHGGGVYLTTHSCAFCVCLLSLETVDDGVCVWECVYVYIDICVCQYPVIWVWQWACFCSERSPWWPNWLIEVHFCTCVCVWECARASAFPELGMFSVSWQRLELLWELRE